MQSPNLFPAKCSNMHNLSLSPSSCGVHPSNPAQLVQSPESLSARCSVLHALSTSNLPAQSYLHHSQPLNPNHLQSRDLLPVGCSKIHALPPPPGLLRPQRTVFGLAALHPPSLLGPSLNNPSQLVQAPDWFSAGCSREREGELRREGGIPFLHTLREWALTQHR